MKASIDSIETMGLVDGPGIRVVIFFNGCKLRCKFCHNPETWCMRDNNMTVEEVYTKIMRCEPYFRNNGGVTFSGGEPLLHSDFIIEYEIPYGATICSTFTGCKNLKKIEIRA